MFGLIKIVILRLAEMENLCSVKIDTLLYAEQSFSCCRLHEISAVNEILKSLLRNSRVTFYQLPGTTNIS